MKKLAMVLAVAFTGTAMVAPALATTGSSNDSGGYTQHAADCLALLFTDPKAHAEQCGGPNFNVPDPPHGSTGFKSCGVAEIDPFGIDGVQYKQVAVSCCYGSVDLDQWQPLQTDVLVWGDRAFRIALAGC